ncbi:alkanesulfonate monooxygenase SsuD/methylene tetrahydromethanopterin reductase-like flavin-dependent oxidoreductase (luciferase family) [Williamsia limnetica]|uniref:Alkanesulfonate monooxygenase SsuD/methylene tetrahydromethanopterin reductase-like flavin-dependent oxidoreductase (Luciferase family) n=1 Tax=Williamsia limnetica TaxID=882452 RepID=A0A318R9N8_WILLI|nr:alkanesulfonate monooxygenase SsuD/methylene tetrahydromethanopterin reductase-like flavin-dependent oxidoreductase (luciferase family) [Williamsia limnetica]
MVNRETTFGINAFGVGEGPARFSSMVELALEAEAIGCAAVWTSELYSRSATIPMAAIAAGTSTISIGSNIAYGVGRSPLMWAAEARDLDELSGGRIILGLGNGTPKMMEAWHGVSGEAPAARMAELVSVLRKLWKLHEGPVDHDGRFYQVHIAPTAEVTRPIRDHLPIWIAGVNRYMLRTAGGHADGLVGHPMFTSAYVQGPVAEEIAVGATAAGRDPADITMMGIRMCAIDDDEERARRQAAFAIGQYAASRVYDRLFESHGWGGAQLVIRQAARDRDIDALIKAVPDEAIDAIAIACRPAEFEDRLAAGFEGFDHVDLIAPPWGLSEIQIREINRHILGGVKSYLAR